MNPVERLPSSIGRGNDVSYFGVDFKEAYPKVTVDFQMGTSRADLYTRMSAGEQADNLQPDLRSRLWPPYFVDFSGYLPRRPHP